MLFFSLCIPIVPILFTCRNSHVHIVTFISVWQHWCCVMFIAVIVMLRALMRETWIIDWYEFCTLTLWAHFMKSIPLMCTFCYFSSGLFLFFFFLVDPPLHSAHCGHNFFSFFYFFVLALANIVRLVNDFIFMAPIKWVCDDKKKKKKILISVKKKNFMFCIWQQDWDEYCNNNNRYFI